MFANRRLIVTVRNGDGYIRVLYFLSQIVNRVVRDPKRAFRPYLYEYVAVVIKKCLDFMGNLQGFRGRNYEHPNLFVARTNKSVSTMKPLGQRFRKAKVDIGITAPYVSKFRLRYLCNH